MSHPTRVRGLKYSPVVEEGITWEVAPYAGAWIEIFLALHCQCLLQWSHPTRVRGLKFICQKSKISDWGRTLRGCVD